MQTLFFVWSAEQRLEIKMQKTKMGISVGVLGSAIYFLGLFSGYTVILLLVGYVLLFESNEWLRKSAVKAVMVMLFASIAMAVLNFIPEAVDFIDSLAGMFGGYVSASILLKIVNMLAGIVEMVENVLLLVLGIKAVNQGTVNIPVLDKLIARHMR